MIEIKNLLFQPLTFHLDKDGKTIHLNARERKKIRQTDMSAEIKMAEKRRFVSLKDLSTASMNNESPVPSDQTESDEDVSKPSRRKKGGK